MAPPGRGLGPRGFLTEEEKKNLPKIDGALIKRILSYLLPYWPQFDPEEPVRMRFGDVAAPVKCPESALKHFLLEEYLKKVSE